ncbi:MAG: hypothetical protein KC731_18615 [Myxococcales bacterium]|nr:hypothetical protein [Myxococcales bacterium]
MTSSPPIGILGIGVHLPADIRSNDWWADELVARWSSQVAARHRHDRLPADATEGQRLVLEAMAELASDPFRGAVERRVMADGTPITDLEIAASREALDRAGVAAEEIDLLLTGTVVPDHLTTNPACTVHAALGLPRRCLTLSVDSACNGFHHQVTLAEAMIAAGQARKALLVQSSNFSRILPYSEPYSAWFGDGASAVVLGEVSAGHGLLGRAHRTDGELQYGLVSSVVGGTVFDEGRIVFHAERPECARGMLDSIADNAKDAIAAALRDADLLPEAVDFYACHQGFPWLRRVTQRFAGLTNARSLDTFRLAANAASVNVPLVLAMAEREGMLNNGDVVVTYGGGSGITWSSLVLRWGR